MPDSSSSLGDCTGPADRITSLRAEMVLSWPSRLISTPVATLSVMSTRVTTASVITSRLARCLVGLK